VIVGVEVRGSGVNTSDISELPGDNKEVDGEQMISASPRAGSSSSFASCNDTGRRPEVRRGVGLLRSRTRASIPCELGPEKGVRGCAGSREEDGEEKEERGLLAYAGIERGRRRGGGAPTRNFLGLEGSPVGREMRGEGGDRGLFIGGRNLEDRLGFRAAAAIDGYGRCRAREGLWPELEGDANMRARNVSGRWEGATVPFRDPTLLVLGPHVGLGRNGSSEPLYPFLLFHVFPFLFSCFIQNLFKIDSKQFKPKQIIIL
jgi:hypothetical protein